MADEPSDREIALAGEVERLARQVAAYQAAQEARTARVEEAILNLTRAVSALTQRAQATPPAGAWMWPADPQCTGPGQEPPRLTPGQAARRLDGLRGWLARVYLRYPDAALPSCWAWHPEVVEELLWLQAAHYEAYCGPQASGEKAGNWHDRYRLGVVRRIRTGAAGRCELAQHRAGQPAAPGVVEVPLAAHLSVVAGAWASREESPEPTAGPLEAAEGYARRMAARLRGGGGSG